MILDSLGSRSTAALSNGAASCGRRSAGSTLTKACRVWGTAELLSAPHAALVNGALVQSFELDDVHRQGILHVGAVTLPPLLAVTELRHDLSGRDFLRAAVAGYESVPVSANAWASNISGKAGIPARRSGCFPAVSGAAAALRLSGDQAVHALGIAGTQSCGLMAAQYGAMVKRMHAGRAAQSGLYGALLADAGYTGIVDVFELHTVASARHSRARTTGSISTSCRGSSAVRGKRCASR